MGCNSSVSPMNMFGDVYSRHPELTAYRPKFETLMLGAEQVGKLYAIYAATDADNSGEISFEELLAHIDLDRTPFSKRVFCMFDDDGSGSISFYEFVLTLWNYCSLSSSTLIIFAFDLYDRDSSGFIDRSELVLMLKDIYGSKFSSNPLARGIAAELESKCDEIGLDGSIGMDAFREFCRKKPALLFPAFQMQNALQRRSLGIKFWEKFSHHRLEVSKGEYLSMAQFMELHIDGRARDRLESSLAEHPGAIHSQTLELLIDSGPQHKRVSEKKNQSRQRSLGDSSDKIVISAKLQVPAQHKFKSAATTIKLVKKLDPSHETASGRRAVQGVSAKSNSAGKSGKSVRFDADTTVHSPDHTSSGKLKSVAKSAISIGRVSRKPKAS